MSTVDTQWRNSVVDQVGTRLRQRILRQGLRPGDRLPSYRDLALELDVAYMTIKRGVDALAADGFVKSIPSKGVFVAFECNHKPAVIGHALLIFPSSLHYVMSNFYEAEQARGVLSALEPEGLGSIRSMTSEGIVHGDYVERVKADAVVMMGVENDEYLQLAANWGRPLVVTDYCSESVPMDCVACDNRAAARRCVEHLASLGHRRIAYLGSPDRRGVAVTGEDRFRVPNPSDARERREGVLAAAAACGLPEISTFSVASADRALLEECLARMFDPSGKRPTAVVLESDIAAPDVIRGLAQQGLRVPQDISVCAVAGAGGPAEESGLTYCRFDFYKMGRKAVEALREQIARPGPPVNRIHRIGFEWVEGSTCGRREA